MPQSDKPFGDGMRAERPDRGQSSMLLDHRHWVYLSRRYELTPREVEIAELICQGVRQGSVARQLHIQPGTVKTHIRNIYRKVKVRTQLNMLLKFVNDARCVREDLSRP